ncbi:hypothetical protein MTO96_016592 [Rhipicephalus appendiculatus]
MVAPSRVRDHTFAGRLPQGATSVELVKALVKRFAEHELKSVQDFGAGRFEVTFKTKVAVDRFLADSAKLSFKDSEIQFEFRGHRTTVVRVLGYPADSNDHVLWRGLETYGKVQDMTVDNVPGFKGISSGNRRVRMLMSQPVPNLFKVDGKTIQCEYEGVVRLCRRCLLPEHIRKQCETPQCERCNEFGHLRCKAPCKRCGGDHAVLLCKQKYSSRAWGASAPQATTSGTASTRSRPFETPSSMQLSRIWLRL